MHNLVAAELKDKGLNTLALCQKMERMTRNIICYYNNY